MKKFITLFSLLLVALMALSFAACGNNNGGTVDALPAGDAPSANVSPAEIDIGRAVNGDYLGDAWYPDGVVGDSYICFTPADNSSIGLAYIKVEKGETVASIICAQTEDNHIVDAESAEGESSIDVIFADSFKAYDYKTDTWYIRGNPDEIAPLFAGTQLACQGDPTNTLLLNADGTGTEVFGGEEYFLTWELTGAATLRFNDGQFDYTLEIVTDEDGAFVSLSEQNHRIFVPADQAVAIDYSADAASADADAADTAEG